MNIPLKVLKTNSIPNEKVRTQQKIAQKYYNSVIPSKQNGSLNDKNNLKEKSNSQNQIKIIHNIFPINNLKEEIIRWFFSFGLNHKMVITCIENKWLINCIHFMYSKLKNEPNTKFSYLDGEAPECGLENYHYKISSKQPIIFTNKKMNNNLFFHFFSTIEDNKKNNYNSYSNSFGNHSNFTFNNGHMNSHNNIYNLNFENFDYDFLKYINFYKSEESDISNDYCSYMSLSEKIIENEIYFLKIFDFYSKGKAFNNFIPSYLDSQSKFFSYGMPDWFNKKEAYSLQEIMVAYFEQTITVKFVLFHSDPNNYIFYYNKYLKNCYIKKLKEESDPAIYNENLDIGNRFSKESNSLDNKNTNTKSKNKFDDNKNFNIKEFNSNEKKINEYTELPLKTYPNNSMNSIYSNFELKGEYSIDYNYNPNLDTYNINEGNNLNTKNLNFYFHNLNPIETNYNKEDFEKNLSTSSNFDSPTKSNINNINISNSNKSFSFVKSIHNVRIHLEKERNYPKSVYDIPELECYLKKILKEKTEITSLFYSEIKTMEKLYYQTKGDKLMQEVNENKDLKEFLEKKSFNPQEFISFNRHSKLLKKVNFTIETPDSHPFNIDLKGFITSHHSVDELLNNIIFLDINQLFTFDDIILKRLFDNIYSIYTYKNLMDLIAEEDKDSICVDKLGNNNRYTIEYYSSYSTDFFIFL